MSHGSLQIRFMENKRIIHSENHTHNIRGKQVIVDRDLAELFCVETKMLKQSIEKE
jgi:hypothetical protein